MSFMARNGEEQRSYDCLPQHDLNIHISLTQKYPAKSHARRVAQQLDAKSGFFVVHAATLEFYPNSDEAVPFRQDRHFYYLSGCNEWNCSVSYDIQADKLTLWLPAIDESRVVWTGRGSTVEEAIEKYDIDEARYISDEDRQNGMVPHASRVLSSIQVPSGSRLYCKPASAVEESRTVGETIGFVEAIDACREIKDEFEIDLIRAANRISGEAHLNVMEIIHTFDNEAQVEGAYMQTCIARHAKVQAYPPIVGSGKNGAVLHYSQNEDEFGAGETLVIDAGCEVSCYASDVTRTLPLNKKKPGHWPSKEAEEIYDTVHEIQRLCIEEVYPGNSWAAIELKAKIGTINGLIRLGILEGDSLEILKAGTYAGFFPHGLGHSLGLDTHDVGTYAPPEERPKNDTVADIFKRLFLPGKSRHMRPSQDFLAAISTETAPTDTTRTHVGKIDILKPNMVMTVEPGIYFNDFLLESFFLNNPKHTKFIKVDVLKRYMKVGGVRIEDDILVTKHGYENLTTAPKGKEMLKIMRKAAEGTSN